ncbi:uncharacterized protein K452DRAFT_292673 [Aplosporella prunicola CBS 121167]|uniref:Uncharacterized protein n=1 Tax=Aplosporella prunicola CBS 121167 TaxID=1176127 RepID=A0A6A6B061_9PEZI|nr:uncharacterized protein K452DRAFT_292673 [Aplosporella prunicola CBS 121167]KAF2136091.1 hypothetical protein K452DRAFT_292673 [Aplosporella prunicola CBS 121167]
MAPRIIPCLLSAPTCFLLCSHDAYYDCFPFHSDNQHFFLQRLTNRPFISLVSASPMSFLISSAKKPSQTAAANATPGKCGA